MNQGEFGSRAFDTSYESGRTKVKNIELGRQIPTSDDLVKMATVLAVPVSSLIPAQEESFSAAKPEQKGFLIHERVLDRFPGIRPYLDMLNKAVRVDDAELVEYISHKLADLFHGDVQKKTVAS